MWEGILSNRASSKATFFLVPSIRSTLTPLFHPAPCVTTTHNFPREVGEVVLPLANIHVERILRDRGSSTGAPFSRAAAFSMATVFFVHLQEQVSQGGIRISICRDCQGMITPSTTQPMRAIKMCATNASEKKRERKTKQEGCHELAASFKGTISEPPSRWRRRRGGRKLEGIWWG